MTTSSTDPYVILGIDPTADDAAVRAAFHARVRAGTADAAVNGAYAAVRDAALRQRLRWCSPSAYLAPLPTCAPLQIAAEPLVRELAFLSDWELGAIHDGG